jgi:hypothetical protein
VALFHHGIEWSLEILVPVKAADANTAAAPKANRTSAAGSGKCWTVNRWFSDFTVDDLIPASGKCTKTVPRRS